MVNRPPNWEEMSKEERMAWLRSQRHPTKRSGGPRRKLTEKDREKVWGLIRTYENISLVAEMLGVSRRTLHRFVKQFPIPETFETEKNVEDYPEIKVWITRQKAFSKESVMRGYLRWIQKFHDYQKENHPDRVRPKLWRSDDILEWVQKQPDHLQHNSIVALRQLNKKAPKEFPMIDLGLLPTRRTHKKKRSLAGKEQYYFDIQQVKAMVEHVPAPNQIIEARNQTIISLLFNIACRTGDPHKGKGLCGILIENLHLDEHRLRMQDKGDIWWNIIGLANDTIAYLRRYLELRGNPRQGFLFVNEDGKPIDGTEVNDVITEAGHNAGIKSYDEETGEGKRLVAKSFRKSLVKYALDDCDMNPACLVGTGKQTKTCFCVGWSDIKILMEHYAPKLEKQIEKGRKAFKIGRPREDKEALLTSPILAGPKPA